MSSKTKRYNLVLPEDLYDEVKKAAEEKHTTVVEILRQFIKLGLLMTQIENSPEAKILIREGDSEKELILI